ncbi:MAG: hypothetical protein IIC87_04450 [Chloroflexi bacterium]|nr:hypothetical protein [Chloroflexota bacterium]
MLLAVQPAWWYTASRTLQPNVLFASLLIAAAYMYFAAPLHTLAQGLDSKRLQKYFGEKRLIDSSFAGIFLGLALAVRLSEAYWIALVVAVLIMQRVGEVSLLRIFIVVLMTWVMLAPFLITNNIVYGGMFATGYGSALGGEVVGAATGGKGAQLLGSLQPYLFPLGFAPRLAAQQFVTYGVSFFWWWSLLVVGGLSMIALEIKKGVKFASSKNAVSFAIVAAFVAVWLIPFYGSWVIHDNPDPAAVTIGASYIRYWLPIFILSTLPVVAGFELLYRRKGMMTKKRVTAALLVVAAVSAVHVFRAPQEGLVALNENMHRFADEREVILAETEGDAVVIVEHADKFIFPHRRVVYPLRSESTYKNLPILSRHAPIYYYGITFPETDLSWLQNEKLPPMGLSIEPITTLGEQTLYRFITLSDTVHDSGGE